jgi:hypothetical protein
MELDVPELKEELKDVLNEKLILNVICDNQ